MPSLKDLRNRISSVKATQKITKAMQMVAAAKLRRAPWRRRRRAPTPSGWRRCWRASPPGSAPAPTRPPLLAGTGSDKTHLLVVCTAERGLCGGFNASIARLARDRANALLREGKTVKIICVGKKGADILRRQFSDKIIEVVDLRGEKVLDYGVAAPIGAKILDLYDARRVRRLHPVLLALPVGDPQIPTALQLIPLQLPKDAGKAETTSTGAAYEYEPDEEDILAALLPRNISVQVFRALLENAASEQGARMSAMDSATRNAGEMIKKQTMQYNRSRQAMITKELIEIISGAEAL